MCFYTTPPKSMSISMIHKVYFRNLRLAILTAFAFIFYNGFQTAFATSRTETGSRKQSDPFSYISIREQTQEDIIDIPDEMLNSLRNSQTNKLIHSENNREKKEDLTIPAEKHEREYYEDPDNPMSKPLGPILDTDYFTRKKGRNTNMANTFQEFPIKSSSWMNTRNAGKNPVINYLTNMANSNQHSNPQDVGKQMFTNLATSALSNQLSNSQNGGKQALTNLATSALANQLSNSQDGGKQALTNLATSALSNQLSNSQDGGKQALTNPASSALSNQQPNSQDGRKQTLSKMVTSALSNAIRPREQASEGKDMNPNLSDWNIWNQVNKYLDMKRRQDVSLVTDKLQQRKESSDLKNIKNLRESDNDLENFMTDTENIQRKKPEMYEKKSIENKPISIFTPENPTHYEHAASELEDGKRIQNRMTSNQTEVTTDEELKFGKLTEPFIKEPFQKIQNQDSSTSQEEPAPSSEIPFVPTNNSKRNSESNSINSFGHFDSSSAHIDNKTEQDSNVIELEIYGEFANSAARQRKELTGGKNAGKTTISHDWDVRSVVLVLAGIALFTLFMTIGTCLAYQLTKTRKSKEEPSSCEDSEERQCFFVSILGALLRNLSLVIGKTKERNASKKKHSMSNSTNFGKDITVGNCDTKTQIVDPDYDMIYWECPKHPSSKVVHYKKSTSFDPTLVTEDPWASKHHRSNEDSPEMFGKMELVASRSSPILRLSETNHIRRKSSLYVSTSAEGSVFRTCRSGVVSKLPSLPTISSSSNADDSDNKITRDD